MLVKHIKNKFHKKKVKKKEKSKFLYPFLSAKNKVFQALDQRPYEKNLKAKAHKQTSMNRKIQFLLFSAAGPLEEVVQCPYIKGLLEQKTSTSKRDKGF